MTEPSGPNPARKKRTYVPAVGPGLQKLLAVVFGLFALLAVNSTYLVAVTIFGKSTGQTYENWFYLIMFLLHLVLGLALVVPLICFGVLHIRNTYQRLNRRAVNVGYALFATSLLLLGSGVVLTRVEGILVVNDPTARSIAYWMHVITPLVCAWLFILHRLAGKRIQWKIGLRWSGVAAVFAGGMLILQAQDPRTWNQVGNPEGEKYFFPSLARTFSGDFIPSEVLVNDQYCLKCHEDIHASWSLSAHKFSSFSNPAYLASVRGTREFAMQRDGTVNASRFCAGCHDPVPFFSGQFNDPDYDMENDPTASAGITCTVCHSITHINSPRGNADYTVDEPIHYPFTGSQNRALQWINEQLIKAKPDFHKKTFLKPLHRTTEFCGTCHKVHLPEELNGYKWLRGQNHQDSFWLSGVSGQGVASFYYPPVAERNCNKCHMPLIDSDDFSARVRDDTGQTRTLDHQFPSANTAILSLAHEKGLLTRAQMEQGQEGHEKFNEGVMRIDLFGLKRGGAIDGELLAPLRPLVPALQRGESYLMETVIRTLKMGHLFTQGTVDSNEVWVEMTVRCGDRIIGRSGALDERDRSVDPWSHYVNAFVLDKNGDRINRRNAEDIFTPLYNHQIPPGAADVVHFRFTVPDDVEGILEFETRLLYRKFDTEYMRFVTGDDQYVNELPILVLAEDRLVLPVAGSPAPTPQEEPFVLWQRWNDYGIALLRKGERGELRQAEQAFQRVEELGQPDGPINLARVYLKEGRVTHDAPEALRRARDFDPPGREWSVLWFTGLANKQNAHLDEAISNFRQIVEGGFEQAQGKGFDFSKDYSLLIELGNTLYERAKQERGEARRERRNELLHEAIGYLDQALLYDPEDASAHYNLKLIYTDLDDHERADAHGRLHARYKDDDNARDKAIAAARRRYPAANHAAEAVVIYDLQRPGTYGLPEGAASGTR